MTLDEFEQLITKAQDMSGGTVRVVRCHSGMWEILPSCSDKDACHCMTCDEVVAKLREWAMPPKPDQFTITLSRQTVEDFAKWHMYNEARHVIVETVEACKKALEPWNTP